MIKPYPLRDGVGKPRGFMDVSGKITGPPRWSDKEKADPTDRNPSRSLLLEDSLQGATRPEDISSLAGLAYQSA